MRGITSGPRDHAVFPTQDGASRLHCVLDNDTELQGRTESLFKGLLSKPRSALGPSIDEMGTLLGAV